MLLSERAAFRARCAPPTSEVHARPPAAGRSGVQGEGWRRSPRPRAEQGLRRDSHRTAERRANPGESSASHDVDGTVQVPVGPYDRHHGAGAARQRGRHGQGLHDTDQLVQRGALPSWHVCVGDAQAAQLQVSGPASAPVDRAVRASSHWTAEPVACVGPSPWVGSPSRRVVPPLVAPDALGDSGLLEDHVVFATGWAVPRRGRRRVARADVRRRLAPPGRQSAGPEPSGVSVGTATPLPSRFRVKAACASARTSSNASDGIASGPKDT